MEPTGETKERKTPAHLATYENCRVREETHHVAGMRRRALHKVGIGDAL